MGLRKDVYGFAQLSLPNKYSPGDLMKQSFLMDDQLIILLMLLAVGRIILEIIGFEFKKLPLTKVMRGNGEGFHRFGLYMSIGYILLFAPQVLFSLT